MSALKFSLDYVENGDPWSGVMVDLDALRIIVCDVFRVPVDLCGSPVRVGFVGNQDGYARAYSVQLPSHSIIARVVAPVRPLVKTEGEVAAMDFVRAKTSIRLPVVYSYCSEADNPVGAEWLLMEHVQGVTFQEGWDELDLPQKLKLALDLIDVYDQMSKLKADACGSIYHTLKSQDDFSVGYKSKHSVVRSPRWRPLSSASMKTLARLCSHSVDDDFNIGPLNDSTLIEFLFRIPSPEQTPPTYTAEDYVKLIAYKGNPTTRSDHDNIIRKYVAKLFSVVHKLYPNSCLFGPSAEFVFAHGDLHHENVLIDPQSGSITGIIDWECAGFGPVWHAPLCPGWFNEDAERMFAPDSDDDSDASDGGQSGDRTCPYDPELRAFFHTEMYKRNHDLFSCFLGGVELRSITKGAAALCPPLGSPKIFLGNYVQQQYWKETQRGPFPWDQKPMWAEIHAAERAEMARKARARAEAATNDSNAV